MKYSFIYFLLSWIHIEVIKGINYENKLALTLWHTRKDSKEKPKKKSLGFRRDNV
jgi:hypothetical protein